MTNPERSFHPLPRTRSAERPGLAATRLDVGHVALEVVTVAPDTEVPPHGHARPHLCYVLEGELLGREGARERVLRRRGVRVSPGGDAHLIRAGAAGFTCLVIRVADEALAVSGIAPPDARRWLEPGPASGLAAGLFEEARRADDASPVAADMLATELLALVERFPDRAPADPPPWLARVRERLEDDPLRSPSLSELAGLAGVSRAHVARAFRRRYGRTVGEHLRALRVERARGLLTSTELPPARVAVEAGFADQSHMHRALSRRLGMTPGRLRAATRADATPVQDSGVAPARY